MPPPSQGSSRDGAPPDDASREDAALELGRLILAPPQRIDPGPALAALAALPAKTTTIGPLTLTTQVDPARGEALVTAVLAQVQVAKQMLTLWAPSMDLDVAISDSTAKGTITLVLMSPPQYSSLAADIQATTGAQSYPYKGDLDSWVATAQPVLGEFTFMITGELSTLTTVRGFAGETVLFSFISGATPIASTTVTQFTPVATFPYPIIAGHTQIATGAVITLTIATTIQPGQLFLQATVSSQTVPPTPIASSVANWTLPPTPGANEAPS